jgi:hypothetical protein
MYCRLIFLIVKFIAICICKGHEQINLFNYLGNMISYEKELDIDNKLRN